LWYITLNDLNWHWRRSPTQCATMWHASQLLWVNPLLAAFLCMITLLISVKRLFLWNEMGSLGWSNIIWSWWFPLLMLPPPSLVNVWLNIRIHSRWNICNLLFGDSNES
jgi:hypothetical protein